MLNFSEKYEQEKLQAVEGAVKMSEQINQQFGFGTASSAHVTKIGIVLHDDGTTSFFAELEKTSEMQRERIEKAGEWQKI